MIVRDSFGIIVQQPERDGGDSACRAGIMALCESAQDQDLLHLFAKSVGLVRHPYQAQWNKPELTSRDQLICFMAGTFVANLAGVSKLAIPSGWFINKDFLSPDVRWFLYKCAQVPIPIGFKIFGPIFMFLSLLWNCFVKPNDEQNQFVCQCVVMGPFWIRMLIKWHPGLYGNIRKYWGGWRDQSEIGEALIQKLGNLWPI